AASTPSLGRAGSSPQRPTWHNAMRQAPSGSPRPGSAPRQPRWPWASWWTRRPRSNRPYAPRPTASRVPDRPASAHADGSRPASARDDQRLRPEDSRYRKARRSATELRPVTSSHKRVDQRSKKRYQAPGIKRQAEVAELADAVDSKSIAREGV